MWNWRAPREIAWHAACKSIGGNILLIFALVTWTIPCGFVVRCTYVSCGSDRLARKGRYTPFFLERGGIKNNRRIFGRKS